MKINPGFEINEASQGCFEINFYVIAKKEPRFKRITINVEGSLSSQCPRLHEKIH